MEFTRRDGEQPIREAIGATGRSVAVIVRSERLAGKVLQGRYKPETKTTYRGEGPTQVLFDLTS